MTESTSEYKKRIEEIKQSIENEPYMAKMREDIAEGISKTGVRQATVEEHFQSVLDETTGKDVISAPEVILARGGAQTLGDRLDSEKAEVTAQLAQTMNVMRELAVNIEENGAVGDDETDNTTVITQLIYDYPNIYVPEGVFQCSPHMFNDLKNKKIFGPGTLKVKNGSSRAGLFVFVNAEKVHIEHTTFDGNVGKVSRLNIGLWDDLIAFVDARNCSSRNATYINSDSLGLSIMNQSNGNIVENNKFRNCRFAGFQIHGGKRTLSGAYDDNKMPVGNVGRYNDIEDCGEGIRASGTVLTEISFNRIRNLKSTGTDYAIHVYTATHPGYDLAMGTQNILVAHNQIETKHKPILIGVVNNVNDDFSGRNMEGIKIVGNKIKLKDFSTPIAIRGFNTPNAKIIGTIIEDNLIDNIENHTSSSGTYPSAIAFNRYNENISIKRNRLRGTFRYMTSLAPQDDGVIIKDIVIEDNDYETLVVGLVQQSIPVAHTNSKIENLRIHNQKGYIEETSGSATLTINGLVVNHGLGRTPNRILLTPRSDLGLAKNYWLYDVTGSVFKINLDTNPGEDVVFDWVAT